MYGNALCELLIFKLCEFENKYFIPTPEIFPQKMGRTNIVFGTLETKNFSGIEPKAST